MGDFDVRADVAKNRLHLRMSGVFRSSEGPDMLRRFTRELDDLRRGFDVILDMTDMKPGSPETADMLCTAGELIRSRGRRRGVRLGAVSANTLLQFKRELAGMFEPESTRNALTASEAEHILDTWDAPQRR